MHVIRRYFITSSDTLDSNPLRLMIDLHYGSFMGVTNWRNFDSHRRDKRWAALKLRVISNSRPPYPNRNFGFTAMPSSLLYLEQKISPSLQYQQTHHHSHLRRPSRPYQGQPSLFPAVNMSLSGKSKLCGYKWDFVLVFGHFLLASPPHGSLLRLVQVGQHQPARARATHGTNSGLCFEPHLPSPIQCNKRALGQLSAWE